VGEKMNSLNEFNFIRVPNPYGKNCPIRFECSIKDFIVRLHVDLTHQNDPKLTNEISSFKHHTFSLSILTHTDSDPNLEEWSSLEEYKNILSTIDIEYWFHQADYHNNPHHYIDDINAKKVIEILNCVNNYCGVNNTPKSCSVCGILDKWNGPSAKHNNSIRCYQHCE